jgi:phospholipase/carboxylesterase
MSAFSLSRRSALLAAMGWAASACHSRTEPASVEADSEEDAASEPFGGLQYATGGDLAENERGGTTVVFLHGFGASADDLISLARAIAQSRTRYIVPAGPLELPNGGRAWWPMRKRPSYSAEQVLVVPEQKLAPARSAVQGLLTSVKQRFSPESLFLIGFSQGAMLALDVALIRIATPRETHPAVFVSHGRQDPVLRFQGAEHLVDALKSQGFSVTFRPFDGGHEISPDTTDALKAFLQG